MISAFGSDVVADNYVTLTADLMPANQFGYFLNSMTQGFTANPDAFEHSQGFFEVFNGAGNFDSSRVLEGWAEPLNIVSPGIAIKQYPCCGSTHPAIDAMLALVRDHGLTPDCAGRGRWPPRNVSRGSGRRSW